MQRAPHSEAGEQRRWVLCVDGLEWRSVGLCGFVYHRGAGLTYAMPRVSTELLARIGERTPVTEQELLSMVAEYPRAFEDGDASPASREELLAWALQPLTQAGLIRETT
ncbi:MAG: HPr-rel-A system PqqD family peptide chaperone [Halorhodospira sp.]